MQVRAGGVSSLAGRTVTGRHYVGYGAEAMFDHYAIDIAGWAAQPNSVPK